MITPPASSGLPAMYLARSAGSMMLRSIQLRPVTAPIRASTSTASTASTSGPVGAVPVSSRCAISSLASRAIASCSAARPSAARAAVSAIPIERFTAELSMGGPARSCRTVSFSSILAKSLS